MVLITLEHATPIASAERSTALIVSLSFDFIALCNADAPTLFRQFGAISSSFVVLPFSSILRSMCFIIPT